MINKIYERKDMYRQGDILFIKIEIIDSYLNNFIPFRLKQINTNILVEGSLTGHCHKVLNGDIYFTDINKTYSGIFAYIKANKDCMITHDEHNSINLPEGFYECRRQREVDHYVTD